jgi:organic radical activating enzyme
MSDANDSFCAVPWVQLSTKPNGNFRLCCLMNTARSPKRGLLSDADGRILNAATDHLTAAVNAPEARDIRRRMLNGERPSECATCWQKESVGLPSKRTVTNQSYAEEFTLTDARKRTDPNGATDVEPSYFDLRFGNLCNLRCVMCHPASSSQWYQDYRRLWNVDHFVDSGQKIPLSDGPSTGYDWHESEEFWGRLEARVPSIRQIYLVGGEPMLIDRHFEFLELCVRRGVARQIVLEYDTNLTRLTDRALDLWAHFKKVILRVSIDDHGERNDYIRFPSKWSVIEANLCKVRESRLPLELFVSTTWQVLNLFTVPTLWEQLGFVTSTRILNSPLYMDVGILPWEMKQEAIARFRQVAENKAIPGWRKVGAYIRHLEKTKDDFNPEQIEQFKNVIRRLDAIRGTSYARTFPELHALLPIHDETASRIEIEGISQPSPVGS